VPTHSGALEASIAVLGEQAAEDERVAEAQPSHLTRGHLRLEQVAVCDIALETS
jgi:hypothetical protein